MVAYESPKFNGLQAQVSYNMGKDSDNGLGAADYTFANGTTKVASLSQLPGTLMPQTAVSLAYANGPLTVAYGYTTISNAAWKLDGSSSTKAAFNTTAGASFGLSAQEIGAQYTIGEYSFGGVMETTSSNMGGVSTLKNFDQTQRTYALIGAYKSGKHEFHLRYALADSVSGTTTTDTGATQYSLMYAYELNKSVKFASSYTSLVNQANAKFTSASGFAVDTGATMTQVAIGLAASF